MYEFFFSSRPRTNLLLGVNPSFGLENCYSHDKKATWFCEGQYTRSDDRRNYITVAVSFRERRLEQVLL